MNDAENETIDKSLKILLTPDGRGVKKKAQVLKELVCCINPNLTREAIEEYIKGKP